VSILWAAGSSSELLRRPRFFPLLAEGPVRRLPWGSLARPCDIITGAKKTAGPSCRSDGGRSRPWRRGSTGQVRRVSEGRPRSEAQCAIPERPAL